MKSDLRVTLICLFTFMLIVVASCTSFTAKSNSNAQHPIAASSNQVVVTSDIKWEPLNPARGDKSPLAGTIWGDRNGPEPTGFLAKFADGFSSPPHIHNVSYRAVVISGQIHNDDPDAAKMWMPVGSFWTQPKGEVHITAAQGNTNIALVEIDSGPYLVQPTEEASDSGERPVNVDATNLVWVQPPGMPDSVDGPKLAYLWGKVEGEQPYGTFIKLPAGFSGEIHSRGETFRAVVITGQPNYRDANVIALEPGSYFSSQGESVHKISSNADEESIFYINTNGQYELTDSHA